MNLNLARTFCCFYGADGQKLHAVHYKARKTRGIVLVVHGRNELNLKYEETCLELINLGMDVFAYDHRFQGFNCRPYHYKEVCHIDSFRTYVNDLEHVINQLPTGYPFFILAISMGGAITLQYLFHKVIPESLLGVAFISPLIVPIYPRNKILINIYTHVKAFIDKITFNTASPLYKTKQIFKPRIFGIDANTHDEKRHDKYFELYEKYPQCRSGVCSASWLIAMQHACNAIQNSKYNFKIPTLFLVGKDDFIVDPQATETFIAEHNEDTIPPIIYKFGKCYHDILIEHDEIRNCAIGCIEDFIQNTMLSRLKHKNKSS